MIARKRVAALALALASVTVLSMNSAPATPPRAAASGWLDEAGLHLGWNDAWRERQDDAADDQKRAQRDYERCLEPGPKFNVGGLAADLLRGRGGNLGRYLTPQRPSAAARSDCKRPELHSQAADEFRIVAVPDRRSAAHGSGATLMTFAFRTSGDNLVARSEHLAGQCVAIVDAVNQPVAVRDLNEPDPYSFRSPFSPETDRLKVAGAKVEELRGRLAAVGNAKQAAGSALASLTNYNPRTNMCTTPARSAYPPRPNVMSDAAIEDQAAGSCVDLMMNRHDPAKVIGALRSVRQDAMIAAAKRYRAQPASCASSVMHSQMEDATIRMICAYTDFGCYGQMQNVIAQCMATVRSSCGAPLITWRRRIAEIDAAPENARRECESARNTALGSSNGAEVLRAKLALAESELAAARAAPRRNAVSLADAHCGG